MNRRKTIYRGFNKRRKNNGIKVILTIVTVCLAGGYGFIKIKDSDIIGNLYEKVSNLKLDNFFEKEGEFLSYDDFKLEKEEIKEDVHKEEINNEEVNKEVEVKDIDNKSSEITEDVEVAVTDSWNIYTIQVASVQDDKDMKKIESQLVENKIPFSVVEIDGVKKVQTYGFFDKDITRSYLEEIKVIFSDAFVSEMKIPVLSLEYSNKYSYISNISDGLNKLIKNFEQESKFWAINKEDIDLKAYNDILKDRKQIVLNIKEEAEKIDYSSMNVFKDNLIKYTKEVNDKIDIALKASKDKEYNISESIYISSMQGYFLFINSIKEA